MAYRTRKFKGGFVTADIKRYHQWIATLPCAECGIEGHTQTAHYSGLSKSKLGGGMAKKSSDLLVAPLCHAGGNGCHSLFDGNEMSAYEDRQMRRIDASERFLVLIAQTLVTAYTLGKLKL